MLEKKSLVRWGLSLIFIIGIFYFLGFNKALFYRPISIHQSAQCSRASIALNYSQESMNFFVPRVHGCKNTTGITGSEFPLMNYMAAICYKVFGFNEFWYRFLMLVSITIGLVFSIKLTNIFIQNHWVSFLISLLWFMSPVLVYYSPNFNPDTASLGFIMISWYFFFRFIKSKKNKDIFIWFLFALLSSLIKIVSLISVLSVLTIIILSLIRFINIEITRRQIYLWIISSISVFILVFLWYKYARYLTISNNNAQFSLRPHSPKSWENVLKTWETVKWQWIPYYYNNIVYWFMGLSLLAIFTLNKYAPRILIAIMGLLYIGAFSFIIIMFPQFNDHDYYIITLLPAVFFHFMIFFIILKNLIPKRYFSKITIFSLLALCTYSTIHAKNHQRSRYGGLYYSWEFDFTRYYDLEPELRKLGITKDEKFVSLHDWTPNNSLYLINQKGWTINKGKFYLLDTALNDCKYAIINDLSILENKKYSKYFNNPIAVFNDIFLFKITHSDSVFKNKYVYKVIDSLNMKNKRTFFYDFEKDTQSLNQFKHIKELNFQDSNISHSISRSGEKSLFISKSDEYNLIGKIDNNFSKIKISIFRKSNNSDISLVFNNPKMSIYLNTNKSEVVDSLGWEKLTVEFKRNFLSKDKYYYFMIHNPKKQEAYFDDLEIEIF
jgi:hypothetical protein